MVLIQSDVRTLEHQKSTESELEKCLHDFVLVFRIKSYFLQRGFNSFASIICGECVSQITTQA